MKKNLVTNILLIVVIVLLIITLIPKNSPNPNRYSMYVDSPDAVLKIDRQTGQMWLIFLDPLYLNKEIEIGGSVVKRSQVDKFSDLYEEKVDSATLKKDYGETP